MAWIEFWADGHEKKELSFRRVDEFEQGVLLQAERLLNDKSDAAADRHFLLLAANNLRAAAHKIASHWNDSAAKVAVAAYDAEVGDAKDLRDFIEHFEDYDWGPGKLQTGNKQLEAVVPAVRAGATETFRRVGLDVEIEILGKSVTVQRLRMAAQTLAAAMRARKGEIPNW